MSRFYEEAIRICDDIEDECWGIRHDILDGVLDEEQALREILHVLRIHLALVLDLLRQLEEDREPDAESTG